MNVRIDRVIVIGASGCSQSSVVDFLRREFGVGCVVDDWNGLDPLPPGSIALAPEFPVVPPSNSLVMSYECALRYGVRADICCARKGDISA